ncbi:MAG: hypothetical protein LBT67_02255 [Holosporaceae bacterium]|jgi:hypothetical protein|nr:hypothetical protein [Holosporaceae bacterium]
MSEIIYLKDILLVKTAKKNKKSSSHSRRNPLKAQEQRKTLKSSLVEKNEGKKTTFRIVKSHDQSSE